MSLKIRKWQVSHFLSYPCSSIFKDTSYVWGKKQQSLQLLYILPTNSANKPSFHRVIDKNIQKLLFFAVFTSYIASILKSYCYHCWHQWIHVLLVRSYTHVIKISYTCRLKVVKDLGHLWLAYIRNMLKAGTLVFPL